MEQNNDRYFKEDEYPSKILCFFIANRKSDIYTDVQSCIERTRIKIQYFSSIGKRTMSEHYIKVMQLVLHAVPAESFSECVLIVEDNPAVREVINQKM